MYINILQLHAQMFPYKIEINLFKYLKIIYFINSYINSF